MFLSYVTNIHCRGTNLVFSFFPYNKFTNRDHHMFWYPNILRSFPFSLKLFPILFTSYTCLSRLPNVSASTLYIFRKIFFSLLLFRLYPIPDLLDASLEVENKRFRGLKILIFFLKIMLTTCKLVLSNF